MTSDAQRPGLAKLTMPVGAGLALSIAVLYLTVPGCSQSPVVMFDTPTGPVTLNAPAPDMPDGNVGPPPGLEPVQPIGAQAVVSRDGNYTGTAVPLMTGGGLCLNTVAVSGFRVRGSSVRYGGFRGTIAADGGLQMAYGTRWIIGQFEGATFHGQLDLPLRIDDPGCSYMLNLQRTGS